MRNGSSGADVSRGKTCVAQKLHHFQWWQSVQAPAVVSTVAATTATGLAAGWAGIR